MSSVKLDNPVWHSLQESQRVYAFKSTAGAQFYDPEYCSFGAFTDPEAIPSAMEDYAKSCSEFFVVGNKPGIPSSILLKNELCCRQMLLDLLPPMEEKEEIVLLESPAHKAALFTLVDLVQPGYFREKTADMGRYYGIFKNNVLIAASGERMQMHDFTEISAVVTHPEHTGKGYAQQLVAHTAQGIIAAGKQPFLHVAHYNERAIRIYHKLGFHIRTDIYFRLYGRA